MENAGATVERGGSACIVARWPTACARQVNRTSTGGAGRSSRSTMRTGQPPLGPQTYFMWCSRINECAGSALPPIIRRLRHRLRSGAARGSSNVLKRLPTFPHRADDPGLFRRRAVEPANTTRQLGTRAWTRSVQVDARPAPMLALWSRSLGRSPVSSPAA